MNRTWAVNLACVALLAWGALRVRAEWNAFSAANRVTALPPAPSAASPAAAVPAPSSAAVEAWTDIPARNPFSFDRNDLDLAPVVVETLKVTPPKPVLFGVVDLGSGRRAMLGNSGTRFSSQAVKTGEKFGVWTVVKIEPKTVVVASDGVEETLELGNVPVDREAGKTATTGATTTVVTTAPSASAVSAPAGPAAPRPGLAPGTPVAAPPGTVVRQTPFGPVIEQAQ